MERRARKDALDEYIHSKNVLSHEADNGTEASVVSVPEGTGIWEETVRRASIPRAVYPNPRYKSPSFRMAASQLCKHEEEGVDKGGKRAETPDALQQEDFHDIYARHVSPWKP